MPKRYAKRKSRPIRRFKRRQYKRKLRFSKKYNPKINFFKRYCGSFEALTAVGGANTLSFGGSGDTLTFGLPAAAGLYYSSLALTFGLSDLPNYTEYTALFDQYKILGVAVRLFPLWNSVETPQGPSSPGGIGTILHSVIDLDDNTAPGASSGGIDALRQYKSYKAHNMAYLKKGMWSRYCRPKILSGVYNGVSLVSAGTNRSQWLDCSTPTVPHYGLKFIFETNTLAATAQTLQFKIEAKFYLAFRGQV